MEQSDTTIDRLPRWDESPSHVAAGPVRVEELAADRHGEWDAYIAEAPNATFFHRSGWMRAVRDLYGHRARYYVARESGSDRVCGVLPLFAVSGPLTGRALISIPYAVGGGVAADDSDIEAQLVDRARQEADQLQVRYLELRQEPLGEHLTVRDHYFAFRAAMPNDPEQVLGRFPRKARAEIRKARDQFGLTARFGHDLLETFYDLYVRSLRRLGSPGHSWRFLSRLVKEFGDDCIVEVIYHEGNPVAGVMSFRFRDQILPYYAGIDDRYNRLNTSNYLYFALMEHAVGLGLRVFDFGRTRRDNIGGCQFKTNQGFEPEPMLYSFYSPRGAELPDLRPSNAAFSRTQDLWRRLPLSVAGPLGGVVSRWLP
ncbi:FemAB family XrtA/PEP-CTERM system-associated protein [Singulisphaera acidiphila]|uniref:FemAB-related protein, PEP-CTERM system-associated n=1 Tax=Singulisphaera acidiphila (strain ATCC BAA-1392 / DSM 18658 / VKM B-2454 / MOB10) TaxID=886293 RepID=L0DLA0_SINAD|nr:FemAB family XrtA/PEP-CTERM system-associated protein [Singulisphaera acidiphila]AGA29605.1 FemAB-related protein, PEP-CTERM system-associated [Singulisphaera acidiphila DSM 18658]